MFLNEAECLVLKRTLEWIVTLERYNVILEMDCKLVVDDINKNKLKLSEYDVILQDCKISCHITTITKLCLLGVKKMVALMLLHGKIILCLSQCF
jgi:hypothetical protein